MIQQTIKKKARSVQLVTFPDTGWSPVKVVRGKASAKSNGAREPDLEKAEDLAQPFMKAECVKTARSV